MGLKAGDLLKDLNSSQERFKISSLLKEGRSFFVALGQDTHLEDMQVVMKSIRYPEPFDAQAAEERRGALRLELEALTAPSSLLPEPIDFLEVSSEIDESGKEPVLVLEFINGKTLREEVLRAEAGIEAPRALALVRELAMGMATLHAHGFVYRDLNPDHVIVGFDDNIHLVGTGNIARIQDRPFRAKEGVSENYSAPEIRHEVSGKFITPRADVYCLGALLSFLLTGVDPSNKVESPLKAAGYKRLSAMPEGYGLLVAKAMEPMAKKRFKSAEDMLKYLSPSALPSRTDKPFIKTSLPAPFDLNEDNRATNSRLSAGPLISVQGEKMVKRAQPPWYRSCLPWASAVGLVLGAAAYAAAVV